MNLMIIVDLLGEEGYSDMQKWYVVATKPCAEQVAARHLDDQGFQIFLPERRKTIRHARKLLTRKAPLFPGYLFIRLNSTTMRWRTINGTYGVRYIIAQNDKPVPLPRDFVETLVSLVGADGAVEYGHCLKVGDKVELSAGPFAREVGELISLDDRGRVAVLMKLLSSVVPVRTTVNNLMPA